MKPAWPMENWPVKPFTTLSDTARMTLTADGDDRMVVKSSGIRPCRAASRSGSADQEGRERAQDRAGPAHHTFSTVTRPKQPVGADEQDQDQDGEGDGVAVGGDV